MKFGLEIHQRLKSNKLFCSCPQEDGKGDPIRVKRYLHPVYSELGELDTAALEEAKKERCFEYLYYKNCCCLVELDEEPPHPINREALEIALEIALRFNLRLVDKLYVMRKIVIDGSNTSGFQRSVLLGINGFVDTSKGRVKIDSISLEEESCAIVEKDNNKVVYSLDRLGIPLIEISTAPDIKDPEHLRETAEKIGLILRLTNKVSRGLGSIRQDINVSIENGARVEIKGAQDLKALSLLASNEVERQKKLLEICNELRKRLGNKKLSKLIVEVTDIFKDSNSNFVKKALQSGNRAFALLLEKHNGLLGKEINPNRRYGTELADYARVAGVKGIIHSDEPLEKYSIKPEEVKIIRERLNCTSEDAFVIIFEERDRAIKALENVFYRASLLSIPSETRKANEDGTTSFLRPLPGKARLYPETDVPPIEITDEIIDKVRKNIGESLEEKRERLNKMLSADLTEKILRSHYLYIFEDLVAKGVDPTTAAVTLEDTLTMLKREGFNIKEENIVETLLAYKEGRIVKAAIPELLKLLSTGKSLDEAIAEKLKPLTINEIEEIVKENNYDLSKIMSKYRLRVEAQDVIKIIKQKRSQ